MHLSPVRLAGMRNFHYIRLLGWNWRRVCKGWFGGAGTGVRRGHPLPGCCQGWSPRVPLLRLGLLGD